MHRFDFRRVTSNRTAAVSLLLVGVIALIAMLAGSQLKSFDPRSDRESLAARGAALGEAVGGVPGRIIGEQLGYFVAIALGGIAAQRHGKASATSAENIELRRTLALYTTPPQHTPLAPPPAAPGAPGAAR